MSRHTRSISLIALTFAACATAGGDDGGDNTPDASQPDPADARVNPPVIDAPPLPMIDAPIPIDAPPPCEDMIVELLSSPGFDANPTDWTEQAADPIINDSGVLPIVPQSGNRSVWLGGVPSVTRTIYQDVYIPADATNMQVTLYRWIATEESGNTVYDELFFTLRNQSDGIRESLGGWSNVDDTSTWTEYVFNPAGNYADQTVRFHLSSSNDSLLNTNFFIDSAQLRVTRCL